MDFKKTFRRFHSFTITEILVTVFLITILASIVFVAIDPVRRLIDVRNARRAVEVKSILESIKNYEIKTSNPVPGIDESLRMLGKDPFGCRIRCGKSSTFSTRVAASNDDAEEKQLSDQKYMYIKSTDLELVNEDIIPQKVGIRFRNIPIPQGSIILNASIEFTVDSQHSEPTNLMFYGEASDNAFEFSKSDGNISLRRKTLAMVPWKNLPPWKQYGARYVTPNTASIIQEIINRPGWTAGNSLAFIIEGTGDRTAHAFDGQPSMAPLLAIEYVSETTREACLDLSGVITDLDPLPRDPRVGSDTKTYYAVKRVETDTVKVIACGAEGGKVIELAR